ncbi:hypothetical protein OO015_03440 [Thermomicrobium sp. 4228-Ro]|uniref:hypothetical protein n=1 Tax=Thermomicrobium sp. 4228-Ro TaxID=2993937 RepID=UPI0022494488|nr:hypothetical protein [Thermomicrobium sp. 4228-Ro]MCX2726544.1 hypothetical protein [Thermomicrobium sp. 4228-Ro]
MHSMTYSPIFAPIGFVLAAASFVSGLFAFSSLTERTGAELRARARSAFGFVRSASFVLLVALAAYYFATALWPAPFARLFPVTPLVG